MGCCDIAEEIGEQRAEQEQEALLRHLCDAFRMSDERHEELLANARAKMAPEIRLNVEVIRLFNICSLCFSLLIVYIGIVLYIYLTQEYYRT